MTKKIITNVISIKGGQIIGEDYEEGREFFIKANYKKALKKFKKASKKSPKNIQYLYAIGSTLAELEDIESSLNYYNQVLRMDPNHIKSIIGKINALWSLDRLSEATEVINSAIDIHNNGIFYAEKAFLLRNLNKPESQVMNCINHALKINEKEPYIWYLNGAAHSYYLNWDQAIISYNKALKFSNSKCSLDDEVFVSKFDVLLGKTGVFDDINQWDKASESADELLNLYPNNVYALYYRSHFYHFMGDNKNSLNLLKKALDIDPENLICLNLKGLILIDERDYKASLAVYEEILELDPKFEDAFTNISLIYYSQKEYQKTINVAKKALKLDPNSPNALYWGSKAARKLGKIDLAREWERLLNDIDTIFFEKNLQEKLVNEPWRLEKCGYNFKLKKREFNLKDRPGRLDLLYENKDNGDLVVVELKVVDASKDTYNQILNYMDSIEKTIGRKKKVTGLVIATGMNNTFKNLIKKNNDVSYIDHFKLGLRS